MEIHTVGAVGLGYMGLGMAAMLARKRFTVLGYARHGVPRSRRPAYASCPL
jgi:UDP-N-acetyl-D-mannosaminuronate dehydrogenase